jgi:hypothetical protein
MAQLLNPCCLLASGSSSEIRVGLPSRDGFLKTSPLQEKELFGRTLSISGGKWSRDNAKESSIHQQRFVSSEYSGRNFTRSQVEGETVLVAERRNANHSRANVQFPESNLPVRRSNSRHIDFTGAVKEV